MSASLVGSEMCIRDRRHTQGVPLSMLWTTARGRTRTSASRSTCLLYTSTLPDDMQCVDLGGR
eukprot:5332830-Alexandrium_andersonii.AAC.1